MAKTPVVSEQNSWRWNANVCILAGAKYEMRTALSKGITQCTKRTWQPTARPRQSWNYQKICSPSGKQDCQRPFYPSSPSKWEQKTSSCSLKCYHNLPHIWFLAVKKKYLTAPLFQTYMWSLSSFRFHAALFYLSLRHDIYNQVSCRLQFFIPRGCLVSTASASTAFHFYMKNSCATPLPRLL